MYARLLNELPEGQEWLYEVKFDVRRPALSSGRNLTWMTLVQPELIRRVVVMYSPLLSQV
jgi:hypothetical protein